MRTPLSPPSSTFSRDSSTDAIPPLPTPEISRTALPDKPTASLAYTFYPASSAKPGRPNSFARTLVVFLNGLMTDRSSWTPAISAFHAARTSARLPYPALLTYDRYGQGESDRDPADTQPPPSHGHDVLSAVHDLRAFTLQIWKEHLDIAAPATFPALIFVGNSIGCAIARLFAQTYPRTVLGLLLLDSIIANGDLSTIWPDPDAPGFDPHELPPGVSENDVRATIAKFARVFKPDVPNMEGLSRRNLAELLPKADAPKLEGLGGEGPYLTVVGHDWETFAEQGETGSLQTPKALTMTYLNPYWQRYNEGLARITDEGKAVGPIVAVGCGHFVQTDGPQFVCDEMVSLLDRVVNRVEQEHEMDCG